MRSSAPRIKGSVLYVYVYSIRTIIIASRQSLRPQPLAAASYPGHQVVPLVDLSNNHLSCYVDQKHCFHEVCARQNVKGLSVNT